MPPELRAAELRRRLAVVDRELVAYRMTLVEAGLHPLTGERLRWRWRWRLVDGKVTEVREEP